MYPVQTNITSNYLVPDEGALSLYTCLTFVVFWNRNAIEKLEVDASAHKTVDIANIVKEKMDKVVPPLGHKSRQKAQERPNSESFVDDPDVPPLEWSHAIFNNL